jgi:hypothetical protein
MRIRVRWDAGMAVVRRELVAYYAKDNVRQR